MSKSLKILWSMLGNVRSLRFSAQSYVDKGWIRTGSGQIIVTAPHENSLVFSETGYWHTQNAKQSSVRFQNTLLWQRTESSLLVSHLRHGVDQPVFLFELTWEAEGIWRSNKPHECGQDIYSATLSLSASEIEMQWQIMGPKKNEVLIYQYA